jgi:hypothetical protein
MSLETAKEGSQGQNVKCLGKEQVSYASVWEVGVGSKLYEHLLVQAAQRQITKSKRITYRRKEGTLNWQGDTGIKQDFFEYTLLCRNELSTVVIV